MDRGGGAHDQGTGGAVRLDNGRGSSIPRSSCPLNSTTSLGWPQMLLGLTLWIFGLGISTSVSPLILSQYPGPLL